MEEMRLPLLLLLWTSLSFGFDVRTASPNSCTCAPVYGTGWLSRRKASVKVMLETSHGERSPFGYIIYEHRDEARLGVISPSDGTRTYFCTEDALDTPGCTRETLGKLMTSGESSQAMASKWVEAESKTEVEYEVPATGYYCVRLINPATTDIKIKADFINPYGDLPAEYRPLMNMSLLLCLVYGLSLAAWSFLLVRHSRVIVSFQKYVAGVLALSLGETGAFYVFYAWYNATGKPSSLLLVGTALIGAVRMAASLFILLVVAMGYGTVLPSLEERAASIYALTAFYLIASVLNILTSLTTRTSGQLLLLLSTLGIIGGSAAFFTWTFDSLKTTIALLLQRKQYAKLEMYDKLTSLLKGLYTASILCMVANLLFLAGSSSSQAWYARNWNWLWLMTDGWQALLNLVGCLGAAYIFRPRSNNRTYDMNELSSEPLDLDPDDLEASASGGGGLTGPVDMKIYKMHERKQRQEEDEREDGRPAGYAPIDEPEWARADN